MSQRPTKAITQTPFHYGAAYYPELWSEKQIAEDIAHMKKVGINCVRMGEFAWHTMEPKQDQIDLSFFKDIILRLWENGIQTVLCTPTPTPPRWLTYQHPDTAFVTRDGVKYEHGARQHVYQSSLFPPTLRHHRQRHGAGAGKSARGCGLAAGQ